MTQDNVRKMTLVYLSVALSVTLSLSLFFSLCVYVCVRERDSQSTGAD